MKNWSDGEWAEWLLHGATRASSSDVAVRRAAFQGVLLSPQQSPAHSVADHVRLQLGGAFSARDTGLVMAVNHWTGERSASGLHLLFELLRLWKPVGAVGAILQLARTGALLQVSVADRDEIVSDAFHTLAKFNERSAFERLETALKQQGIWRHEHALACIAARVRVSQSDWREHVTRLRRDFIYVANARAKAEVVRTIAGVVGLETLIASMEEQHSEASPLSAEVQTSFRSVLFDERDYALRFDYRGAGAAAVRDYQRNVREVVQVNSATHKHPIIEVPSSGLLRDLCRQWTRQHAGDLL